MNGAHFVTIGVEIGYKLAAGAERLERLRRRGMVVCAYAGYQFSRGDALEVPVGVE